MTTTSRTETLGKADDLLLEAWLTRAGPRTKAAIGAWMDQRRESGAPTAMPHPMAVIRAIAGLGLDPESDEEVVEVFVAMALKIWLVVAVEGAPAFLQTSIFGGESSAGLGLTVQALTKTFEDTMAGQARYLRTVFELGKE